MPAGSPSVGDIPSRAVGLPGIIFVTLRVSPEGHLGPNPYHPSPKVINISLDQISTPLYETSGLLPPIILSLSHILSSTTRTLPPCRQHCSTQLIIKVLLMPLTGPDNPFSFSLLLLLSEEVLWQWNVYHWKHSKLPLWRTRGEISDLHSLRTVRG